jgi:hypothetical protein
VEGHVRWQPELGSRSRRVTGAGDDPDVGLEGSARPPKISLVSIEADTLRVGPNPANTEPRRATFIDPVTAAAAPFSARPAAVLVSSHHDRDSRAGSWHEMTSTMVGWWGWWVTQRGHSRR